MTEVAPLRHARRDPTIRAVVLERRPLAPLVLPGVHDVPDRVRAASGVCRARGDLWIVQDDTLVIARVRPGEAEIGGVALPPGPGGLRQFDDERGNKRHKLDLEGVFASGPHVWALGSGSLGPREVVVRLDPATGEVVVRPAADWYAHLRSVTAFAGSELNVEGAARRGRSLILAQRGNGAVVDGRAPVDALGTVSWHAFQGWMRGGPAPTLQRVQPVALGEIDGVRLTFTDLTVDPAGRLVFLAAAEASPDATRDGPVVGVAVGVIDDREIRYNLLTDVDGRPWLEKAEGLTLGRGGEAWVVTDTDTPSDAAGLLRVKLAL